MSLTVGSSAVCTAPLPRTCSHVCGVGYLDRGRTALPPSMAVVGANTQSHRRRAAGMRASRHGVLPLADVRDHASCVASRKAPRGRTCVLDGRMTAGRTCVWGDCEPSSAAKSRRVLPMFHVKQTCLRRLSRSPKGSISSARWSYAVAVGATVSRETSALVASTDLTVRATERGSAVAGERCSCAPAPKMSCPGWPVGRGLA